MKKNPIIFERFVKTTDDFCPNFDGNTVKVSIIDCSEIWGKFAVRTCIWGDGNFGLERDEFFSTKKEADKSFKVRVKEAKQWDIVTIEILRDLTFTTALNNYNKMGLKRCNDCKRLMPMYKLEKDDSPYGKDNDLYICKCRSKYKRECIEVRFSEGPPLEYVTKKEALKKYTP